LIPSWIIGFGVLRRTSYLGRSSQSGFAIIKDADTAWLSQYKILRSLIRSRIMIGLPPPDTITPAVCLELVIIALPFAPLEAATTPSFSMPTSLMRLLQTQFANILLIDMEWRMKYY
jgi:hypothetical protein